MNVPTPNASAASPRLRAVLTVLLVNAVPLIGIHRYGWSAANVLVLYWFENLLIAICTCIRLLVHRHLTRKKGYWRHTNRFGIEVKSAQVIDEMTRRLTAAQLAWAHTTSSKPGSPELQVKDPEGNTWRVYAAREQAGGTYH